MNFTVEENKKIQKNVDVRYIDKKSVKLHINFYKKGSIKDIKELTFSNRERCMIHIENLIKTTDYNLISFSNESINEKERYFITLGK